MLRARKSVRPTCAKSTLGATLIVHLELPDHETPRRMLVWTTPQNILYEGPVVNQLTVPEREIGIQIVSQDEDDYRDGGYIWLTLEDIRSNTARPLIVWGLVCERVFDRVDMSQTDVRAHEEDLEEAYRGWVGTKNSKIKWELPKEPIFNKSMYDKISGQYLNRFENIELSALYQTNVAGCGPMPAWIYFSWRGPGIIPQVLDDCVKAVCLSRNWSEDTWAKKPLNDPEALDALCQLLTCFALSIKYQDDNVRAGGVKIVDWYADSAWVGHDDCEGKARVTLLFFWYLKITSPKTELYAWIQKVLRQYVGLAVFCQTSAPSYGHAASPSGHVRATLVPAKKLPNLQPVMDYLEVDNPMNIDFPILILEATGEIGGTEIARLSKPRSHIRGVTRAYYSPGTIRSLATRGNAGVHDFYYGESMAWVFAGDPATWDRNLLNFRILDFFHGNLRGCTSSLFLSGDSSVKLFPVSSFDPSYALECHRRMPPDVAASTRPLEILKDTRKPGQQMIALHAFDSMGAAQNLMRGSFIAFHPPRPQESSQTVVVLFE